MKVAACVLLLSVIVAHGQRRPLDLISTAAPFTPTGTITLEPDKYCATMAEFSEERLARLPAAREALKRCAEKGPNKIERGALNGVAYRFYYSDGSGSFATEPNQTLDIKRGTVAGPTWTVRCEKDAITDEKSCYADQGSIRIWLDSIGRSELYIGSQHYPGSLVTIRIDKSAPISFSSRTYEGSFGFRHSPAIIKRMETAKTFTTRYQEWPYKTYIDETLTTYGLKETTAYLRWAVKQIR